MKKAIVVPESFAVSAQRSLHVSLSQAHKLPHTSNRSNRASRRVIPNTSSKRLLTACHSQTSTSVLPMSVSGRHLPHKTWNSIA